MNWKRLARRICDARRLATERSDASRLYGDGIREALVAHIQADPSEDKEAVALRTLCRVWQVDAAEAQRRQDAWGEAAFARLGSDAQPALARIRDAEVTVELP